MVRKGVKLPDEQYAQVVALLQRGRPKVDVARETGVSLRTVNRYASDPVLKESITAAREGIKRLNLKRAGDAQARAWDLLDAQVGRKGDPRGFKETMQGIESLDKVTASAAGEGSKVEVSGTVNVDARVLLAQIFGPREPEA